MFPISLSGDGAIEHVPVDRPIGRKENGKLYNPATQCKHHTKLHAKEGLALCCAKKALIGEPSTASHNDNIGGNLASAALSIVASNQAMKQLTIAQATVL